MTTARKMCSLARCVQFLLTLAVCNTTGPPEQPEWDEFAHKEPFIRGMRIQHIWSEELLKMDEHKSMMNAFEEAVTIWSESIYVRNRKIDNLLLSRSCTGSSEFKKGRVCCINECHIMNTCGDFQIPIAIFDECRKCTQSSYVVTVPRGVGLKEADLVLYIQFGTEKVCDDSHAYARICGSDDITDRPLSGSIYICKKMFTYPHEFKREILMHEIAHVLGLTASSYAYLRFRNGTARTPRDPYTDIPILGVTAEGYHRASDETGMDLDLNLLSASGYIHKTVFHFTLPTVLNVARHIFNASKLTSFPIEDAPISGVEKSHFDARTAKGELMTPSLGTPLKITHFLLAYMYDTGWYAVSLAHAAVPRWGMLAGEEFVTKSCYEFIKLQHLRNKPSTPFCGWSEYKVPACLPDRSGFGLCDIFSIKPTAHHAHQLDSPTINVELAEYNFGGEHGELNNCPIITDRRILWLSYRWSHVCTDEIEIPESSSDNLAAEHFGKNSICLDHDRKDTWKLQSGRHSTDLGYVGASCHTHKCHPGKGLELIIGNSTYFCPREGGSIKINVSTFTGNLLGSVHCPICDTLCKEEACQIVDPVRQANEPNEDT